MQYEKVGIEGLILCKPTVYSDDRGYFMETYKKDELESICGHTFDFSQDNESKSCKGTLRGLHFQVPPRAQTKLVRVIKGKVLDVAVDIRKNSPSFGQYFSIELSAKNKYQLLIPRGFAHGFVVLENNTIVTYKVDNNYSPEHEEGIYFNDKELNIDWKIPEKSVLLSDKDKLYPILEHQNNLFDYQENYYN